MLNYLLQKIDRKGKEPEQSAEEKDSFVKNKAAVGAVVAPPVKGEKSQAGKNGATMCQSEPTRMEAGASPN